MISSMINVMIYDAPLDEEWHIGQMDRGLGHYSYGVITKEGNLIFPTMSYQLAEHIVVLHNKSLKESK